MSSFVDKAPKIVVLDDDPTGIQMVHDVAVYTSWEEEACENLLQQSEAMVYILTNTRAIKPAAARCLLHLALDDAVLERMEGDDGQSAAGIEAADRSLHHAADGVEATFLFGWYCARIQPCGGIIRWNPKRFAQDSASMELRWREKFCVHICRGCESRGTISII